MKRALISVSDKTGLLFLAEYFKTCNIEMISSGGTYSFLKCHGFEVKAIEEETHFPEILDGRVKTLHPIIYGGILFKRDNEIHQSTLVQHDIKPIDYVIVNLYPFERTIKDPTKTYEDMIENIDIGGPTLLRAAAKNFNDVCVICDVDDYIRLINELKQNNDTTLEFRKEMASKVFRHTSYYDGLIAQNINHEQFPDSLTHSYSKVMDLRYGENPHQQAAFYKSSLLESNSIVKAEQLHGKTLSFNNIQDSNAALQILAEFNQPCCVAVKHTNPCGVGIADTLFSAWNKAYEADKVSIFGGIVAFNQEIDHVIAEELSQIFLEVILAPSFTELALEILTKKVNVRLLKINLNHEVGSNLSYSYVNGGLLVQTKDNIELDTSNMRIVTGEMDDAILQDCIFAMKVCKHVKSNAIVIAKDGMTLGIGGGQSNRVGAARIALETAQSKASDAILASDAFFPMPDTVELAAIYKIKAIIQPGGSIKDELSIEVCKKHSISMIFTGVRHFKHG
jgi:phosphoribosylaminoimidazolecarboxamide formyltransferase / IMP cyclohydrolase